MQIHTEFREIPGKIYYKNTAEFLVFFKKFRIPPKVEKALPWTPQFRGPTPSNGPCNELAPIKIIKSKRDVKKTGTFVILCP
jgi:hypothetical protein